jgi:hypothetical protein
MLRGAGTGAGAWIRMPVAGAGPRTNRVPQWNETLGACRAGRRAASELSRQQGELAFDDCDRVAVHPGEVDRDEGDQGNFDCLGDVGGHEVRPLDGPADDRRRRVGDEAEADEPAEPDGDAQRDDHRDGRGEVAEGVQGEQQAAERRMDVTGAQDQSDDRQSQGDVDRAEGAICGSKTHLVKTSLGDGVRVAPAIARRLEASSPAAARESVGVDR